MSPSSPDRLLRRPVFIASTVGTVLVSLVAIAFWFSDPGPLTEQDIGGVTTAINKIRPDFDVKNLHRDRDGNVRVFLSTPGQEGGETIVVTQTDGRWIADVERVFF